MEGWVLPKCFRKIKAKTFHPIERQKNLWLANWLILAQPGKLVMIRHPMQTRAQGAKDGR